MHDVASSSVKPLSTSLPRDTTCTALRFFPSGVVLLAATSLYELRVISAPTTPTDFGTTPRVLKGHRRVPTDIAIIERGRTVLSCAKDGTARLWDVGAGSQAGMWAARGSAPIFKMALGAASNLAWLALGDGCIEAHDLSAPAGAPVLRSEPGAAPSAAHAVTVAPDGALVAAGSRAGFVRVYDVRASLDAPLYAWRRNGACVEDLAFDGGALLVAAEDGLAYRVQLDGLRVVEEFVGVDCDPVRGVRCTKDGAVWTGGDDGVLRRY